MIIKPVLFASGRRAGGRGLVALRASSQVPITRPPPPPSPPFLEDAIAPPFDKGSANERKNEASKKEAEQRKSERFSSSDRILEFKRLTALQMSRLPRSSRRATYQEPGVASLRKQASLEHPKTFLSRAPTSLRTRRTILTVRSSSHRGPSPGLWTTPCPLSTPQTRCPSP